MTRKTVAVGGGGGVVVVRDGAGGDGVAAAAEECGKIRATVIKQMIVGCRCSSLWCVSDLWATRGDDGVAVVVDAAAAGAVVVAVDCYCCYHLLQLQLRHWQPQQQRLQQQR